MTIDAVPEFDPDLVQPITVEPVQNPWLSTWWTRDIVSGVPESTMSWLVSQGYHITGISQDSTTVPPTLYYALGKDKLLPAGVLYALCNSFTRETNNAREVNQIRYNAVVTEWKDMIVNSQEQFENQVKQQNFQAGIYVRDLDEFMTDIESLIDSTQTDLAADARVATEALDAMNSNLDDLETNANNNAEIVGGDGGLLVAQATYLSTFLAGLSTKLAELDTNYAAHLGLIQSLLTDSDTALSAFILDQATELSELASNHDSHSLTASGFLSDLGNTERARIYEEFAASLSVQLQNLVDSGLYTSVVRSDITARNLRDRDEQIQLLNDRLNREQLDNQHKVYGQQVDVRARRLEEFNRRHQLSQAVTQWKATQLDRLLEQLQQIEMQQVAGIEKGHAAQQDVSRVAMSERDVLLAQLQDAVKGILAGKERYAAMLLQKVSVVSEFKHKAIAEKMNTAVARLEGWKSVSDENRQLMAYQLDERNKLLIGLYSFVERREDRAPEWQDMSQMIAGLGDAAGGWITP